ncbi:hypothetical protein GLOIN_2v1769762 [Rhizophagus clarus]|uniref:RING-type domain-containing protein n=1 Tax=Rhizophagus clarus TaxID=94130 RepID=A0A8H3R4F8_9GLOM|nr:hypothetical protein GLOIN_2v1769762 [Rhizophagus clarus]
MENQANLVNTEVTNVDEINTGPIGNIQSREKNSTPSFDSSLVRFKNLGYNILKSLDDKAIRDIDFPELEPCSKCNNDILTFPLREFTHLRCGHIFHRICAEKKLMLNIPNPCPFPNCGRNVEITEIFSTSVNYPIGRLPKSNVTIQDSPLFQSSGTSTLTNMMSEGFILTSSPMRMEGVENIGIQQMRSQLRCVKCSEDLSSCLPPLGFLQTFPHSPPKPLVYLTCKHIIHYNCIDNSRKLCPVCLSTDMELEEEMDVDGEEEPDTSSKKCSNKDTDVNSSTPKKKAKKPVRREDSPILKKLIKELSAPISQQTFSGGTISLQTFPDMNIDSVNFCELNDRIIKAEDDNKRTALELIYSYYYFEKGYRLWFDHYKKTYSDDTSNSLINNKIREYFLD